MSNQTKSKKMKKGDKAVYIGPKDSDYYKLPHLGIDKPDSEKIYTVSVTTLGGVKLKELNSLNRFYNINDWKKVEPQTNALSKELASKVIWEEMIKNPSIQIKEINPKVFDLNTEF